MIGLMPKVFIFALCISFIFANPVIKKNDIVENYLNKMSSRIDKIFDKAIKKTSSEKISISNVKEFIKGQKYTVLMFIEETVNGEKMQMVKFFYKKTVLVLIMLKY